MRRRSWIVLVEGALVPQFLILRSRFGVRDGMTDFEDRNSDS